MRLPVRAVLGGAFAVLAALVLGVAPAAATVIHRKLGAFTGADAPGGPFGTLLAGDAVDQSNGDVYVTESAAFGGQNVVDKFNEAGEYAGVQLTGPQIAGQEAFAFGFFPGVAVDNSTGANKGDVYVADAGHHAVDRFSDTGAFLCEITGKTPVSKEEGEHECDGSAGSLTPDGSITPSGIAVDTSGVVYVADDAHAVIDRFGETGAYLGQVKDPHISNELGAIALDKAGTLYVTNLQVIGGTIDNVVKFDAAGAFAAVLDEHGPFGVGIDPSTGNVYVYETSESHEQVAEYESSGALLDVTPTPGAPALGLAVDGTSGKLYEAGVTTGSVAIFSGDIAIPTVTALPATDLTETTASLNGHLDPDAAHGGGEITACEIEWGETIAYGHVLSCTPGAPYTGASDVTAPIAGLKPAGTYHFRVKAANANGSGYSEDATFATSGPPSIEAESSRVNGVAAELTAQVNPYHLDTTCRVQYVDDASFLGSGYASATTAPCAPEDLGSGYGDVHGGVTLRGLKVGTTYHYRFIAANPGGSVTGADRTFVTFGIHEASFEVIDEAGLPFTQAGGHPYELRTGFGVNWTENVGGEPFRNSTHPNELPTGNVRTVLSDLPPGLIGNPSATPKCTRAKVLKFGCSAASQVGVLHVVEAVGGEFDEGIYNLVPPKGVAVELGANVEQHLTVYIDARLRGGGDYGVTAESATNSAIAGVTEVVLHLWGDPGDPRHDPERCPRLGGNGKSGFTCAEPHGAGVAEKPFLRNPTSCEGPLSVGLAVDSYQAAGLFDEHVLPLGAITGCDAVPFAPSIVAAPTTDATDSPSGLGFDLHLPQPEGCKQEAGKAVCETGESDLKDTTVAFPAGLTVNPSSADGLSACSEAQVGFTGFVELNKASEPGVRTPQFTPLPAQCPDASKLGTVEVDTPLLDHPLTGSIYLAKQGENPFGSLLAIYITIYDPVTGVVVKLPGEVKADPATGRLTTTVDQNPQVPFADFKINLFEDPRRAALTTPATCGTFTTTSSLTPWSGGAPASPTSSFEIASGAGGGACPATAAQEPFGPSFSAGTYSPIAGSYSPLVLRVGREDGSQQLQSLNVTLPPGLLGKLAGIQQCPQGAIEAAQRRTNLGDGRLERESPSCPAGSEIGSVHVGVGSGAPYYVTGHAYLAGPYEGAPYSAVAIAPAVAGPFDLGVVVVRSGLFIDPHTAQVTVKSDPFPTMLYGIPVDIRSIAVLADRTQFTLNPTSCAKMSVTGTIASTQGTQASVSSPFQVGGCNNLPFKPSFAASSSATVSHKGGASLTIHVTSTAGQANIKSVHVELPKALPSRLSTLNHACLGSVFNRNPADCPPQSRVGLAKAVTPAVPVPLEGPAYFVSRGAEEFPDLVIVLQGDGVTVDLVGTTSIENGTTSSTFQVPDVPVGTFELTLPEGPFSALAANTNLCTASGLVMPTVFDAQTGAQTVQKTRIAVSGCPFRLVVLGRRVRGRTLRLSVSVPAAGRLAAYGRGVWNASKSSSGRQTLTLRIKENHAGKLRTKIVLRFSSGEGKKRRTLRRRLGVAFA